MANYTTNLHLEKPEYNETADIEIINQNMEKIDSEMTYKTATGTGTEITLSLPDTFGNGYNTTFIATANNNGAATTVNGKPLYKPNTTTPPNITSGKAYSIWYNAPGDCFFIKASAEGDADASHVLATKKFSNDNDTGLVGTMPNNGALNGSLNAGGSFNIPAGYTKGGTITANSLASQTQATAGAGDILSGKTAIVNGNKVTGTMANNPAQSNANSLGVANNNIYVRVPFGAYLNQPGSGYPEIVTPYSMIASAIGLNSNQIVSGNNVLGVNGSATVPNLLKYASGTIAKGQTINVGFNILVMYIGDANCFDLPTRTSSEFSAYVNFNGTLLQGGVASHYTSSGKNYIRYTMYVTVSGTSITSTAPSSFAYYVIGY